MWFLIILGAFVIFVIIAIMADKKKEKKLALKATKRGALDLFVLNHFEGLGIAKDTTCEIYRFDEKILIESGTASFEIKLENIRAAVVKSEREIIETGKSVVGRAVIGTLLLPGLGTIIGGMSGVGSKKKKGGKINYFILNYIDSKGELSAVTLKSEFYSLRLIQFCKGINDSLVQFGQRVIQL